MSTRGIDTGTGRPEDYTSRVETGAIDNGGPKMPDLRNVRSEPAPQAKPRRASFVDTVKDALQPGDVRARKASQGSVEAGPAMGSSPTRMSMSDPDKHFRQQQTDQKQQQHQMENLFESALHGPDYHHTPGRHRSHGVMDHLLGRSRAHDDTSGIIGSRRDRAKLSSTKSTGPGEMEDPEGYTFDVPRGSKEDPKRSAVDAVPRTSALDTEGAMSHEYSTRGSVIERRASIGGTRDEAHRQGLKDNKSPSQYLTDSGLYE
ncbi:hypothetical protein PG993_011488 [Apiospora rasikravindrae]|uniref:Uncharacterized protein n=1 Tax=Apiospora rasikravindrae TaxID=990691 RepID=A0ABR1SEE3_9PEZI